MPDISQQMSYLQQLQDPRSPNSPMGALNQLASSIGNAWQGYEGRTDQQDAIKFFMEKSASPETIQEFYSTHPRMPLQEIYKVAGTLETQKKAQKMKNRVSTLNQYVSGGGEVNEKTLATMFPDASAPEMQELSQILIGAKEVGLKFKPPPKFHNVPLNTRVMKEESGEMTDTGISNVQEVKDVDIEIGGRALKVTETQAKALEDQYGTDVVKRGKTVAGDTPLARAISAKMAENPGMSYADAYKVVAKQPQESTAHNVQEFTSEDGKTAWKMQYNPETKRYDIPVGTKYPAKSQIPNVNVDLGGRQERSDRVFGATLRKEFNALPEVKEGNLIMPKIKSMEAAFEESKTTNNFVAVDQALITLFNKLTDPSSVVRESEYARTAMNIPLLNQIRGKAGKILEGGAGLTPDERAALMKMAQLMQKGYMEIKGQRVKEYKGYAKQAGLEEDVISDFGATPSAVTVEKKVLNGKTYIKKDGRWYEE